MTALARKHFGRGQLHADLTLKAMRANIVAATAEPECWERARRVVADVARGDYQAQAVAVRKWAAAHYRYVLDPARVELLETPGYLLAQIRQHGYALGDCDAGASLTASLCSALGIPVELWAVSFTAHGGFSHVFAVAFPRGGKMVELDISRPAGHAMPTAFPRRLRLRI